MQTKPRLTREQKENTFKSELLICPHCNLKFRARGLHAHIFLVHVAAPAIERHQRAKEAA